MDDAAKAKQDGALLLTDSVAEKAQFPQSGDYTIRDTKLAGLALRVSPGSKTWIVRRKMLGRSIRHVLGRFPEMTVHKARADAVKALGKFADGVDPTQEREKRKRAASDESMQKKFTVAEMWSRYRNQKRAAKPFSQHSLNDFNRLEKRMADDPLWRAPFHGLTEEQVLSAFERQSSSTDRRATNGGKTTANHYFRLLRTAAQFAIKKGLAPSKANVFSMALEDNWHKNNARKRTIVVDKGSLRRWWEAVDALRADAKTDKRKRGSALIADFQVLALLWGGRKMETLTLEWADVNFEAKTVRFRAEVTKNRTEHLFPMAPHAETVLRRLKALQEQWGMDSPYVFPSSRTGHKSKTKTHIKEPKGAMDKVAEAAGVPFSAHDLRRTFSNLLASASEVGAEQAFVKMAMNHTAADDVSMPPSCSRRWCTSATSCAAPSSSRPTESCRTGVAISATRPWPPPSWTASCTAARCWSSRAKATA